MDVALVSLCPRRLPLFTVAAAPTPPQDQKRDVLRAADETISVLDAVIAADECVRLAAPYLDKAHNQLPVLLATLKLLTKVGFRLSRREAVVG